MATNLPLKILAANQMGRDFVTSAVGPLTATESVDLSTGVRLTPKDEVYQVAETTIEWTATILPDGASLPGFSFNPWVGCKEVSPACDHCYAREFMTKKPRWATAWSGDRFRTSPDYWRQPLKWNREAERSGIRRKVFCASLADAFDNKVDPQWRDDLWALIAETGSLDWLLLTKRPQNIAKMLPSQLTQELTMQPWPWNNVWLGCTAENQEEADRRIPHLLAVPAKVRFLSCEPLLGPLKLDVIDVDGHREFYPLKGTTECEDDDGNPLPDFPGLDWIIAGGESGPGARPWSIQWARELRDQCKAAGTLFFWKQNGEWRPAGSHRSEEPGIFAFGDYEHDRTTMIKTDHYPREFTKFGARSVMERVGKKSAGALLDGVAHKGMPP